MGSLNDLILYRASKVNQPQRACHMAKQIKIDVFGWQVCLNSVITFFLSCAFQTKSAIKTKNNSNSNSRHVIYCELDIILSCKGSEKKINRQKSTKKIECDNRQRKQNQLCVADNDFNSHSFSFQTNFSRLQMASNEPQ